MKIQLATAAVRMSVARPFVKGWNKNGVGVKALRRFMPKGSKGYRIYMPIKKTQQDKIVVPSTVFHAVQSAGYKIEDYINGIAVGPDGKRRIRIGKILRDAEAIRDFANDPQRSAHKDEYTCVISCHPYDVIGMSTGRRWDFTTCMRLGTPENGGKSGERSHYMKGTVAEGTLVAYVISPKDTNINKPHARLLIKPYKKMDDQEHVYFKVETHVYGQPIPGFKRTVENWLKKVNKGAERGIYRLSDDVHIDSYGIDAEYKRLHIAGGFEGVENKEQFVKENMYKMGGPDSLLQQDKRWLPSMMRATKNDGHNLNGVINAGCRIMNHPEVAKLFDEAMDNDLENVPFDLTDFLIGTPVQDMFIYSKLLSKMAEDQYGYDPDWETNQEHVLNVCRYDSRWLANAQEMDEKHLRMAARLFTRGQVHWTEELQESKLEGARRIRLYFAFIAHVGLALKPDDMTERTDRTNLKQYIRHSQIPAGWDEEIVDIVRTTNWRYNYEDLSIGKVSPYSAALNAAPDWAAVFPEWVSESTRNLTDKTVDVLIKMATHNAKVRDELIQWSYTQSGEAVSHGTSFLRARHNIKDFLQSLIESNKEFDLKWAVKKILDNQF